MEQIDTHKFGYKDFLSAQDYKLGTVVKVKVLSFLGRRYTNAEEQERAGFLKVMPIEGVQQSEMREQELRLNQSMEDDMRLKHNVQDYPMLLNKFLTIKAVAKGKFVFWEVINLEGIKPVKGGLNV